MKRWRDWNKYDRQEAMFVVVYLIGMVVFFCIVVRPSP